METFRFKTNLKCHNCVAKVQPALDAEPRIASWDVDLTSPNRTLTVEGDGDDLPTLVANLLSTAGYRSAPLR